jgi:hypothetical protein
MTLGRSARRLRESQDFFLDADVARATHIFSAMLSRVETGHVPPSLSGKRPLNPPA